MLHPRISGRTALWTSSGIICKATLSCNLNVTECLTKTILLLPVNHEQVTMNMTTMDTGSPCPQHLPYYKHNTLPTYLPTYETAGPLLLLRWNGLTLTTNAFYTRGYYYVFSNTFIMFGSCYESYVIGLVLIWIKHCKFFGR